MRITSTNFVRRGYTLGFTLIELLVVVAIIALLIGILVPFFGRASTQAEKAAVMAQLGGLQTAIQQYETDHGTYPPSTLTQAYGNIQFNNRGSVLLAQSLVGFLAETQDGYEPSGYGDMYGFRTRQPSAMGGGRVYGPYASTNAKTFFRTPPYPPVPAPNPLPLPATIPAKIAYFVDPWGKEILYYRSSRAGANGAAMPKPTKIFGLSTTNPPDAFFFSDDCKAIADPTAAPALFYKLISSGGTNAYTNGIVLGSDSYLLVSAGVDGVYFTADDIVVGKP